MTDNQKNAKVVGIVLIVVLAVAVIGVATWATVEAVRVYKQRKGGSGSWSPKHHGPGPVIGAVDPLAMDRTRSHAAVGYSSDTGQGCYNETLIGSVQAPSDLRSGARQCSFPSNPMGTKPVPLGSSHIGIRPTKHGSMGRTTKVDLSSYARMGMDRALGAQGLDCPEDLALASVMLGHVESAGNTRLDTWDVRGEAVGSWQVGYSVDDSGRVQPGQGGVIPTQGPYQLGLRPRGVPY